MRTILKSKIHGAKVTDVCVDYIGSITIDKKMMNLVDIIEYEQVHVLNVTTGARFVTYAIQGKEGQFQINGAAARLASKGDKIIILAYEIGNDRPLPLVVFLDEKNEVTI